MDAGDVTDWFEAMLTALRDGSAMDVPCGTCVACCTSSQFVLIEPDETATLARIPKELRFPAPGLPKGFTLIPYDDHGHCAMFVDGGCSIYADRPRTCRVYDCRAFAATGLREDEGAKPAIVARADQWEFTGSLPALPAAARYLVAHRDELGDALPRQATQLAALAVEIADAFADGTDPPIERVRAAISSTRAGP